MAQTLVDDVARFAAIEDLFHESLDEYGNPVRTETRKYDYVASITESQPGYLTVDEYRTDRSSLTLARLFDYLVFRTYDVRSPRQP